MHTATISAPQQSEVAIVAGQVQETVPIIRPETGSKVVVEAEVVGEELPVVELTLPVLVEVTPVVVVVDTSIGTSDVHPPIQSVNNQDIATNPTPIIVSQKNLLDIDLT